MTRVTLCQNVIDPLGLRLQVQKQLDTHARHAILMTHMSLQLNLEVLLEFNTRRGCCSMLLDPHMPL